MYLNISLIGLIVIIGFFSHGEGKDKYQGSNIGDEQADS